MFQIFAPSFFFLNKKKLFKTLAYFIANSEMKLFFPALFFFICKKFHCCYNQQISIYICDSLLWGPTVSGTQTTLEEARPNIWSHMYELCEKGPGPTSNLRVREYPRTINKRRDKIILRGEVKNARGDLTVSEDYSHLGTSIRGVWWTYQSSRVTPRINLTAKWKGKISNKR